MMNDQGSEDRGQRTGFRFQVSGGIKRRMIKV